eukprot:8234067-Alexandrium_andersonii.AAC.1
MADIRALELQRALCRKRAARWDHMASVRQDSSQRGDLLRPLAPEAPRPPAAAGDTADLVRLDSTLACGLPRPADRGALHDGRRGAP